MAGSFGIAVTDVTTGEFLVTEVDSTRALLDELYKYTPSEIICNEAFYMSGVDLEESEKPSAFSDHAVREPLL